MTIKGRFSILSKVVKRKPQFSHSRLRRIAWPSSIGLESNTFVLFPSQFAQCITNFLYLKFNLLIVILCLYRHKDAGSVDYYNQNPSVLSILSLRKNQLLY